VIAGYATFNLLFLPFLSDPLSLIDFLQTEEHSV